MKWIVTARQRADEALLVVARSSQALVIEALDRTLAVREPGSATVGHRVRRLQFEFFDVLVDDPAKLVDDGYGLAQRLLGLHREFAQRLFDVADPRERTSGSAREVGTAHILPFPARRAEGKR